MTLELRIGVTDVDQLRYYERSDWMRFDELLERFQRPEVQTEPMRRGTAFHAAMERLRAPSGTAEVDIVEEDGYVFDFSECEAEIPDLPSRESWLGGRYRLPSGTLLRLYGKIDAGMGRLIGDYKLGGRPADPEDYAYAYQWRLYLWLGGAGDFRYWTFHYSQRKSDPETYLRVRGMQEIPFRAYPALHEDCVRELERFAQFAHRYLPWKWGTPLDPQAYIPIHNLKESAA